jgi:hypothetical protein
VEFLTGERGLGREHADDAAAGALRRGFHARLHSDDGQGVFGPKGPDRLDRGGIAGDHEDLRAVAEEVVGDLEDALLDDLGTLRAVGAPGGVADVVERGGGDEPVDLTQDRETTDAGIEQADFHAS